MSPPGKKPAPIAERFWRMVDQSAGETGCWLWTGNTWKGYGQFGVQQSPGKWKQNKAHRIAYELMVGPIPDGLQLDHLCRQPSCVNPAHLEPVTNRVNGLRGISPTANHARKTHCRVGHEFTPENTMPRIINGNACRECRQCYRAASALRRAAKSAAGAFVCGECHRPFLTAKGRTIHLTKHHGRPPQGHRRAAA